MTERKQSIIDRVLALTPEQFELLLSLWEQTTDKE